MFVSSVASVSRSKIRRVVTINRGALSLFTWFFLKARGRHGFITITSPHFFSWLVTHRRLMCIVSRFAPFFSSLSLSAILLLAY